MCDCRKDAERIEKHGSLPWWGYLHINGSIKVKRWFVPPFAARCDLCFEKENPSDFVAHVIPKIFMATDRLDALQIAQTLIRPNTTKEIKKIPGLKIQVEPRWAGIDLD